MSIFKESFKKGVREQILARQEALEKRTPDAIQYFNSRNAWIRMTSAVDVDGKSDLAAYHVLQGGMLSNNSLRFGIGGDTQAYSNKTYGGVDHKLGIRPMPGITSIEVESESAYGSIRRVTVNFNCWDIKQLENLEILYMRPGYTALIEWGWAPYLNNSGKLSNDTPSINIFSSRTKEEIWKDIADKSKNGNYDAHYGFIKNYSWSARTDGGYDCSVIIVSIGEILESLKINYNPATTNAPSNGLFGTGPFEKDSPVSIGYNQNVLAGMVAEIYQIAVGKDSSGGIVTKQKVLTDVPLKDNTFGLFRFDISVTKADEVSSAFGDKGYQIYISLRDFITLLNKYILLQDEKSGKPLIPVSVQDSDNKDLLCLGNELQLSTDPTVCLIGNNGIKGVSEEDSSKALQEIVDGLSPTPYWSEVNASGEKAPSYTLARIGNIYVNLEYIYNLCTDSNLAAQDKKEKNDINAYDFLKNMMNGISSAIGNVATFDIFVDPQDGVAKIIDINFTGDKGIAKNAFVIQIQNSKSIVRNYSLKSKIFPEQSTQIAIGAQAEGGALGTDSNTMADFNKNLKDRILPEKIIAKALSEPTGSADKLKNVAENFKVLADYVSELNVNSIQDWWSSQGDFNAGEATRYANALKDIINYTRTFTADDTKNRAIIPTELSIEMDGIGGIIIGNVFKIPNDLLPRGYKSEGATRDVAYVVTGLGHSVQNNDWVTKIRGQLILLDTPSGGQNFKDAASKSKGLKDLIREAKKIVKEAVKQTENPSANDSEKKISTTNEKRAATNRCSDGMKAPTAAQLQTQGKFNLNTFNPTPWSSVKNNFPVVNKPFNVYAVGTTYDAGTDFTYKMKLNKQTSRTAPVQYIVIHYTAGGTNGDPTKTFKYWDTVKDAGSQASADFCISRNGKIAGFQNFEKYFSWHYGRESNISWGKGVNSISIGIELESYGPVTWCPTQNIFHERASGKEYSPRIILPGEVTLINKPYRGHTIFQAHPQAQISALANLLVALYNTGLIKDKAQFLAGSKGTSRYNILFPEDGLTKAPPPGIITHGTGRNGKMDTFPQSNLLEMLDDFPNLVKQCPNNKINWISAGAPPASNENKQKQVTETPSNNIEKADIIFVSGLDCNDRSNYKCLPAQTELVRRGLNRPNKVIKTFRHSTDASTMLKFIANNPNVPIFLFSKGVERIDELIRAYSDKSKIYLIEGYAASSGVATLIKEAVTSGVPLKNVFASAETPARGYIPGLRGSVTPEDPGHWESLVYAVEQFIKRNPTF